jgi:hypothetical protein
VTSIHLSEDEVVSSAASPKRETPMFVFIIVEQNNNRFDESEKG